MQTLRVVLASNNAHKLEELSAALRPFGIELLTLSDPPDPEETGASFAANACIKALAFARQSGLPALADDSGLEVDALDGAPGVRSARFAADAGGARSDAANNARLLELLADTPDAKRTARFRCSLALVAPPGPVQDLLSALVEAPEQAQRFGLEILDLADDVVCVVCDGAAEGVMLRDGRGQAGFGYDPLFLSTDLGVSFAEATQADKTRVSHRGRAVAVLAAALGHLRGR